MLVCVTKPLTTVCCLAAVDEALLMDADKFMRSLLQVPGNLHHRLDCLHHVLSFDRRLFTATMHCEEKAAAAAAITHGLQHGGDGGKDGDGELLHLFGTVLEIGNFMNHGGRNAGRQQ